MCILTLLDAIILTFFGNIFETGAGWQKRCSWYLYQNIIDMNDNGSIDNVYKKKVCSWGQ